MRHIHIGLDSFQQNNTWHIYIDQRLTENNILPFLGHGEHGSCRKNKVFTKTVSLNYTFAVLSSFYKINRISICLLSVLITTLGSIYIRAKWVGIPVFLVIMHSKFKCGALGPSSKKSAIIWLCKQTGSSTITSSASLLKNYKLFGTVFL